MILTCCIQLTTRTVNTADICRNHSIITFSHISNILTYSMRLPKDFLLRIARRVRSFNTPPQKTSVRTFRMGCMLYRRSYMPNFYIVLFSAGYYNSEVRFFWLQNMILRVSNSEVRFFFILIQVWTQKCAVQKASVDVNISYY